MCSAEHRKGLTGGRASVEQPQQLDRVPSGGFRVLGLGFRMFGGSTCRGGELGVPQRRGAGPLQRRQQLAVDDDVCVAPDGRGEVRVEAQGQAEVALSATAGPCVPCN